LIIKILYIATGGALGSILRFFISYIFKIYFIYFPIGTLFINIVGSFLAGLFISYLNNKEISEIIIRYFFIIGFLGSFTTFSAFSIENIELIKQNEIALSLLYIIISIILSISAAFAGFALIKI
tara:strand:+ start:29 stop:400 length:372 start_codon:yes stop_codon:yes gene_type:complete